MGLRLDLQDLLEQLLEDTSVYFQPKANIKLTYPAIVYYLDDIDTAFADNEPYSHTKRYQVTAISHDPENPVVDKIAALPMNQFDRCYTADDLYHHVFSLYF